jgi:hypothetical protein
MSLPNQVIKNHEEEYKEKHKNKKDKDDDDDEDKDDDYYDKHMKNVGKVVVCHKAKETITISPKALKGHIKHGDVIGSCNSTPVPNPNDTTAPIISDVSEIETTYIATHIHWMTNEKASSKVWDSVTTPVIATSTTSSISSADLEKYHHMSLLGLTASTTYYYLAESSDAAGNKSIAPEESFTTLSAPIADTTAPIISALSATSTAATIATITWTTNEASDSMAWYSTTTPVPATLSVNSTALTTSHSLSLSSLIGSTQYYYYVKSKDTALNTATSSEFIFTTPAL